MDPEQTEVVPAADAIPPPQGEQKAEPEQDGEVAHPDEAKADDPPTDEGEQLTDDQKTIKKLQRRIERLNGKVGGTARERDLLREQIATLQPSGGEASETPDIDRLAMRRAEEIVKTKSMNDKADAVLKSGRKLEGFDAALQTLRDEVPFMDSKGKPTAFLEALLDSDSDMAAQVARYLGQNPDEAADFADLSPGQLGRRLAKLEIKLEQPGKVKTSKAPAPITPINGTGASDLVDLNSASMEDYIKRRRKQGARF